MSPEELQQQELARLMVAYQGGDLAAFERLYALTSSEIRQFLLRRGLDRGAVHDLLQDTFLEMHRSRRTYRPPLPVRPWLFGIARNVLARSRRATKSRIADAQPIEDDGTLLAADPAYGVADLEDVESALQGLPPGAREVWLLHHVDGMSFQSIAARLGISSVAARLRSSRASKVLRVAFGQSRRVRR